MSSNGFASRTEVRIVYRDFGPVKDRNLWRLRGVETIKPAGRQCDLDKR